MDSLLVLWSGHVDNCLDSDWVGLKAVAGDTWPMKTASCTRNFILLRFNFTWYCSKLSSTAIRLQSWSILASVSVVPHPGIRMSSVMLMTRRPSRTV